MLVLYKLVNFSSLPILGDSAFSGLYYVLPGSWDSHREILKVNYNFFFFFLFSFNPSKSQMLWYQFRTIIL